MSACDLIWAAVAGIVALCLLLAGMLFRTIRHLECPEGTVSLATSGVPRCLNTTYIRANLYDGVWTYPDYEHGTNLVYAGLVAVAFGLWKVYCAYRL